MRTPKPMRLGKLNMSKDPDIGNNTLRFPRMKPKNQQTDTSNDSPRMSSIKDVAKIAGVSIATVSRFVNTPDQVRAQTAKRVAQAIEKTGYAPNKLARDFRVGKTQQIMVVIPSIGIPFFEPIMRGVRRVADSVGYHILVKETAYNSLEFDDFTRLIMSKQTDGIILLSTLSPFQEPNINHVSNHPPIILGLENVAEELKDFPCVCIDNVAAAREATEFLINMGHIDIGFLYGSPYPEAALGLAREAGFRSALAAANLELNEQWRIDGKLSLRGGRQAARRLLEVETLPTAVFCANDEMAMGAIHEFKQAGLRVPQDISIVGFDDMRYAEVCDPPLTTIAQPAEEIGERSMARLLMSINGEETNTGNEIIPHRLIVRKSTAAPNR